MQNEKRKRKTLDETKRKRNEMRGTQTQLERFWGNVKRFRVCKPNQTNAKCVYILTEKRNCASLKFNYLGNYRTFLNKISWAYLSCHTTRYHVIRPPNARAFCDLPGQYDQHLIGRKYTCQWIPTVIFVSISLCGYHMNQKNILVSRKSYFW